MIGAGVTDLGGRAGREDRLASCHPPSACCSTNSGSEATYAALRLARAVTGRNKIIKFQGTYHGWHDAVLMNVITPGREDGHRSDPLSLGMLPDSDRAHDRPAVQRRRGAARDARGAAATRSPPSWSR